MNWKGFWMKTIENVQKAKVGIWHPKDTSQIIIKERKYIVKMRVVQKAEVGHHKDSIQNIMKERKMSREEDMFKMQK